jgi:mannose-6-phosphate isomerase-like protein (cupin superfamily)
MAASKTRSPSNGGETHQTASTPETRLTTNHGVPVSDNQNSLKAGPRGPSLLEDFVLREKIQHFDHERIPERIVHARGSAAHGYFELTDSLAEFTTAKILTEVGKKPISYRQIGDNLFGRSLQILKERYEPGSDTGRVHLVHDGEEGGIVISGKLEVTVEDERRILNPGDAYYFESRRPHRFRCVGGKPCEVISACTPPTF